MEFVISERGKKHLCLDGYRYREKNQLKNGLIKWQCTFGNCRAVGYLDEQQEFRRTGEEIDASNQSLTLPIGTFSIGCSAENLVRTMRWRHGMALDALEASISSYQQSIQPSPS